MSASSPSKNRSGTRVVFPNFGHPDLNSSFTKYKFLHMKNSFKTVVNGLICFSFRMVIYYFYSVPTAASTKCVNLDKEVRARCPKLGHTTLNNFLSAYADS